MRKFVTVALIAFMPSAALAAEGSDTVRLLEQFALADRCHIKLGPTSQQWLNQMLEEVQDQKYLTGAWDVARKRLADVETTPELIKACMQLRSEMHQAGLLE